MDRKKYKYDGGDGFHGAKFNWRQLFYPLFSFLLILTVFSCGVDYSEYIARVEKERIRTNESFLQPGSPLDKKYHKSFEGLDYYEVKPEYNVEAKVVRIDELQLVDMPTSDGRSKTYYRWGTLIFSLNQKDHQLTAFKRHDPFGKYGDSQRFLFIPFNDVTNGTETYSGGRYIEMERIPDNTERIALDFNLCFNPYCAYGDGWSCPAPPKENYLNIPIKAGVKDYNKLKL